MTDSLINDKRAPTHLGRDWPLELLLVIGTKDGADRWSTPFRMLGRGGQGPTSPACLRTMNR